MTSLFGKIRVFALGNLHALLDQAIDLNSIPVIKQYVRDLETARDAIAAQAASATGRVSTITRNINDLQSEIDRNTSNIKLLLSDADASNDAHAVSIQANNIQLKKQIAGQQDILDIAKQTAENMNDAVDKIKQKHDQMLSRVGELEQLDSNAQASEQAAAALNQAGNLVGGMDASASIDNVEQRIRARNDVANAKLAQAFGGISSSDSDDDAVTLAQAQKDIEDLKASLAAPQPEKAAA